MSYKSFYKTENYKYFVGDKNRFGGDICPFAKLFHVGTRIPTMLNVSKTNLVRGTTFKIETCFSPNVHEKMRINLHLTSTDESSR